MYNAFWELYYYYYSLLDTIGTQKLSIACGKISMSISLSLLEDSLIFFGAQKK